MPFVEAQLFTSSLPNILHPLPSANQDPTPGPHWFLGWAVCLFGGTTISLFLMTLNRQQVSSYFIAHRPWWDAHYTPIS